MAQADPATEAQALHLPRILCLHGGGVNADIFRMQCRSLIQRLSPHFRLVFVDAPFISAPHPAVKTIYADHGPFRRWVRWLPEHPEVDDETAVGEIRYQMRLAMEEDDARGADGPWTALLGFSQGAKIAASLLLSQQTVAGLGGDDGEDVTKKVEWKFGVIMAGRCPMIQMDLRMGPIEGVQEASGIGEEFTGYLDPEAAKAGSGRHVLRIPTIHVHGLKDPGLELHRRLRNEYCSEESARVVEWDGDHRIPIKAADVQAVVSEILRLSDEVGVAVRN